MWSGERRPASARRAAPGYTHGLPGCRAHSEQERERRQVQGGRRRPRAVLCRPPRPTNATATDIQRSDCLCLVSVSRGFLEVWSSLAYEFVACELLVYEFLVSVRDFIVDYVDACEKILCC